MYRTVAIQCRFVCAEWGGCAAPLRRADITTGKRVLRKRGAGGAVLFWYFERADHIEVVRLVGQRRDKGDVEI